MTADGFRRLALTLPETYEAGHQGHPDFRVGKRVFATLAYPDSSWAMIKLTPAQQSQFVALVPKVFLPVKGAWGLRGATNIKLSAATRAGLQPALAAAWKNVAPASVRTRHQESDV